MTLKPGHLYELETRMNLVWFLFWLTLALVAYFWPAAILWLLAGIVVAVFFGAMVNR